MAEVKKHHSGVPKAKYSRAEASHAVTVKAKGVLPHLRWISEAKRVFLGPSYGRCSSVRV